MSKTEITFKSVSCLLRKQLCKIKGWNAEPGHAPANPRLRGRLSPGTEPARAEPGRVFSTESERAWRSVFGDRTSSAAAKKQRNPPAMLAWGVILGLLPVLLGSARGEPIAETSCPGGQSWSPDLEKCMDCSVCQRQNKNDFCSTCGDPQPTNTFNLWVLIGASLGAFLLASIIAGTIIYARCRRREKFTTPIEETGGHSAQESLIH